MPATGEDLAADEAEIGGPRQERQAQEKEAAPTLRIADGGEGEDSEEAETGEVEEAASRVREAADEPCGGEGHLHPRRVGDVVAVIDEAEAELPQVGGGRKQTEAKRERERFPREAPAERDRGRRRGGVDGAVRARQAEQGERDGGGQDAPGPVGLDERQGERERPGEKARHEGLLQAADQPDGQGPRKRHRRDAGRRRKGRAGERQRFALERVALAPGEGEDGRAHAQKAQQPHGEDRVHPEEVEEGGGEDPEEVGIAFDALAIGPGRTFPSTRRSE